MALTACFAGPLFNLLVGCGLGFARWLSANGKSAVPARLDSSVVVGCVFIVLNCGSIVLKGVLNRGVIPRSFGYFMIAVYALYVATSLALLFLL
jgi:sodium/potassium/calcium exchanger 6